MTEKTMKELVEPISSTLYDLNENEKVTVFKKCDGEYVFTKKVLKNPTFKKIHYTINTVILQDNEEDIDIFWDMVFNRCKLWL